MVGRKVGSVALVFSFVFAAFLVLINFVAPNAAALNWTQTTDADFNQGTFTNTEVVGVGAAASVELTQTVPSWINKAPPSPPSAREGPAMAFNPVGGVSVLFGGYSGGTYFNETWEYDFAANTWTQIFPSTYPSKREYSGMAYDPSTQVVVLYGGTDGTVVFSDTWEYSVGTNTWTETTPITSPRDFSWTPLAHDTTNSRTILAGYSSLTASWETWAYDSSTNLWAQRSPATAPGQRSGHALAYDPDTGNVTLFGGGLFTLFGDTWEYSYAADSWTETTPADSPSARLGAGLAYSTVQANIILFSGYTGSYPGDTWVYKTEGARDWDQITMVSNPPGRRYHGIASDTVNDVVVIFGGANPAPLGDTWAFDLGYGGQGTYVSTTFDSLCANVDWQKIWWNGTEAPPTTNLSFQLAANSDDTGTFSFSGPTGSSSGYYEVTGTNTWSGLDAKRYLKLSSRLLSTNPAQTPSLQDFSIDYVCPAASPWITKTTPANAQTGVPLTSTIVIDFSELMDTTSVAWTINPNTPHGFAWSKSDTRLTLTPTGPLQEQRAYTVTVTAGKDLAGNDLVAGPVPNPWTFVTLGINPQISSTLPNNNAVDVAWDASIIVQFSEPMNTLTDYWTITPNIALTDTWSNGNQTLTFTHTAQFEQCRQYTVQIFANDTAGLPLAPGPAPNPWSFTTYCANPYVVATLPANGMWGVAVTDPINITFSEPMNTTSVLYTITPLIGLTPNWFNGDRDVSYTHTTPFTECETYTMNITSAKDKVGETLLTGYFAFRFTVFCANPQIVFTSPADEATGVPTDASISVAFSEEMDVPTVMWTLTPNDVTLVPTWSAGTLLQLAPDVGQSFGTCRRYDLSIAGNDTGDGLPLAPGPVPNPWQFTTVCLNPFIVSVDPVEDETNVAVSRPIIVTFSEPMNTTTILWALIPSVVLTETWTSGETVFTLGHGDLFAECTPYQFRLVSGEDKEGYPLLNGAVVNFTSACAPANPKIKSTIPAHNAVGVPINADIVVEFDMPMNESSLSWGIVPFVDLSPQWSNSSFTLTFIHTTPFEENRQYSIGISARDAVNDLPLGPGPAPNPWDFTTAGVAPYIVSTSPQDGVTDVPLAVSIVIDFSEPMNKTSVVWNIVPFVALSGVWSNGDTRLTLSGTLVACETYTIGITGRDITGNNLVPGPVPNPWSFSSFCSVAPPRGLTVARASPNIRLSWTGVSGADAYIVYESPDRFAPWPWGVLGTTTTTTFTATGHDQDLADHFYIVHSSNTTFGVESGNSTMGVKRPLSFTYSGTRTNINWLSLPYRSPYGRASDIVLDIEGSLSTSTRIDVVAKWDRTAHRTVVFFFYRGQWRGTDFTLAAGDGVYVGVKSSFSWVIVGNDRQLAMPFAFNPTVTNTHWISLPYTGIYTQASDVVIDIEGSLNTGVRIVEVGRWNAATQTIEIFRFQAGTWTGVNFALAPGDALYLRIASSFTWDIKVITAEVP